MEDNDYCIPLNRLNFGKLTPGVSANITQILEIKCINTDSENQNP